MDVGFVGGDVLEGVHGVLRLSVFYCVVEFFDPRDENFSLFTLSRVVNVVYLFP